MIFLSYRKWWSVAILILHYHNSKVLSTTSTAAKISQSNVIVDLSYQTEWKESCWSRVSTTSGDHKSSWFTKHLLDKRQKRLDIDSDNDIFMVDASSSRLGNVGLKQLNDAMVATLKDREIQLDIRMNQLSSEGASFLFDSLSQDNDITVNNTSIAEPSEEMVVESGKSLTTTTTSSLFVSSLDIGLNDLGFHGREMKDDDDDISTIQRQQRSFTNSIRNLIGSPHCPQTLRMDNCGLGPPTCRAIGKGIVNRSVQLQKDQDNELNNSKSSPNGKRKLRVLHLSGNDDIGDAGTAALAAALKIATINKNDPVLDVLDLSSCGIGDTGAEALAMAIQKNPNCVKNLDLSNNQISDDGVMSITRALLFHKNVRSKEAGADKTSFMNKIDLSNNDIGDTGARELAGALKFLCVKSISLRSCDIKAEGAAALAEALCTIAFRNPNDHSATCKEQNEIEVLIDISGNHLGTFETKKKKGSSMLLSSKASTTAASYMNFMKKKLQTGLKDAGLDVSRVMGSFRPSVESDDDEEELMDMNENDGLHNRKEKSTSRCGACSFADTIVEMKASQKSENVDQIQTRGNVNCQLGMRQCFLDKSAADALAAAIIHARKNLYIDLSIDTSMNTSFEKDHISALQNKDDAQKHNLVDMAERYMKALEAIQNARQRVIDANRAELQHEIFDDEDEFGILDSSTGDQYDGNESYENNKYSDDYY